jgi:hypothetical protein
MKRAQGPGEEGTHIGSRGLLIGSVGRGGRIAEDIAGSTLR